MDRPNLASVVHSPASFIAAWQHVHAIFDTVGVPNASWVWCPTATGFATGRAQAFYPGDDAVDWLCADAYPGPGKSSLSSVLAPFLSWAHQHAKPAMIGEFGIPRDVAPDQRAAWLDAAQTTVAADSQIKAVVYFDSGIQGAPPSHDFWLASDAQTLQSYRTWARVPYFDTQHLLSKGDT
jgi:beta-mannanase